MSDIGNADSAAAAVDAAVGGAEPVGGDTPYLETAETEVASNATSNETSDLMDTETEGIKSFDQSYVSKLRAEAAKYRTQAREASERLGQFKAFDGYDQNDLMVWNELAENWRRDPRLAAETMQTIAINVLGDPNATEADKADAAEIMEETAAAETPEDINAIVEKKLAEREQHQQMQARVEAIESTLNTAGYEKGTQQYASVLWHATNNPDVKGDISKAIEAQKAYEQSIIDNYVGEMSQGKTPPRSANAGVAAGTTAATPSDIKEATAGARAWLDSRRGA